MNHPLKTLLSLSILLGAGFFMVSVPAVAASEIPAAFHSDEESHFSASMMAAPLAGILHSMPIRTDDLIMRPINPMGSFHSRMIQQVQLHAMMKQMFSGSGSLQMEPIGVPKHLSKPFAKPY